jgi:hypothetical protein
MEPYNKNKDYCSLIPDKVWGVEIGQCCWLHDEHLSFKEFYKCLSGRIDIFTSFLIALGGTIGAWFKYPSLMWKLTFRN